MMTGVKTNILKGQINLNWPALLSGHKSRYCSSSCKQNEIFLLRMNAVIRNNVVCFNKDNKEMSKKQGILQDGSSTLSSEFQYFMLNVHNANIYFYRIFRTYIYLIYCEV